MRKVLATFLMSLPILTSQATAPEDASNSGRLYEVPGGKLYTQIFGRGPPILFLHGGTLFFDNNFEHQRDYFASYRTVIGIDQRGRGHSPDSPGPFSYKCAAPFRMRDCRIGNHLAPASDGLSQVASTLECLLDSQALGQVRGRAAALQCTLDPSGALHHLLA